MLPWPTWGTWATSPWATCRCACPPTWWRPGRWKLVTPSANVINVRPSDTMKMTRKNEERSTTDASGAGGINLGPESDVGQDREWSYRCNEANKPSRPFTCIGGWDSLKNTKLSG